jgi:hypothetical protein
MRPSAAIKMSVVLALLASAYSIWVIGVYITRVAPSFGATPGIIAGLGVQAILALWGIANSLGLSRRRRWARRSVLLFGGVLILWNLTNSLGALAALSNLPEGSLQIVGTIAELLPRAALVLAGIWWLIVLNRQPLRSEFSS